MKKYLLITSLVGVVALTGCADMNSGFMSQGSAYPQQGYQQGSSYQEAQRGVVESVRNVTLNAGQSGSGIGVGTIGGAVLGGLAGSAIGQGRGSVAAAVGGAAVGGLIGNQIDKRSGSATKPGLEITVKLEHKGGYVTVTQEANEQFYKGEKVLVLTDGGGTRVTRR